MERWKEWTDQSRPRFSGSIFPITRPITDSLSTGARRHRINIEMNWFPSHYLTRFCGLCTHKPKGNPPICNPLSFCADKFLIDSFQFGSFCFNPRELFVTNQNFLRTFFKVTKQNQFSFNQFCTIFFRK